MASYTRLATSTQRPGGQKGTPTRGQRALEITLFVVFAVLIAVSAIALVATSSHSYKQLPSTLSAGIAAGKINILFINMADVPDEKGGHAEAAIHSMTLLSLRPSTRQASMISIPADLWVRISRFGTHRLAAADSLGVSSGYPGEGTGLVSDTITNITGEKVHAVVRMDEESLASLVDSLGGVDVQVTQRFYEWRARKRFGVGVRHLNGERAMWFVSPYVGGPQGEPAARERRHQQLLAAILDKLRTASPEAREQFVKMHHEHGTMVTAGTNLTTRDIDQLFTAVGQIAAVRHVSLTPLLERFQVRAINDSGEALRPRASDYAAVRTYVGSALQGDRIDDDTTTLATAAQTVVALQPQATK